MEKQSNGQLASRPSILGKRKFAKILSTVGQNIKDIQKRRLGNLPSSGQPLFKKAKASDVFEAQTLLDDALSAKTQATNQEDLDALERILLQSYNETLKEFNNQLNDDFANKIANGLQKNYGWEIFLIRRIYVENSNGYITAILNDYFKSLFALNFGNTIHESRENIEIIKSNLQDAINEEEEENALDWFDQLNDTANQTAGLLEGFQPKVDDKWNNIINEIYAVNSESTRAINAAYALLSNNTERITEKTDDQYTSNQAISMAQVPYYMATKMLNSSPQGANVEQGTVTVPLNPYNVIQSVLAGMVAKTLFGHAFKQDVTIDVISAFLENLKSGIVINDIKIDQVLCKESVIKSAFNPYREEFNNACQDTNNIPPVQEALKKLMDFKPPPWRTATVSLPSPPTQTDSMETQGDGGMGE
jgi:hypothetical protein